VRRREFITLLGGAAAAWPLAARAQQAGKLWRIGFVSAAVRPPALERSLYAGLSHGMRQLGYIEGKDLSSSTDLRKANMNDSMTSPAKWCG
jgi:putative ABC transport system substrate-binding protein